MHKISDNTKQNAVVLRQQGLTYSEISKQLGISLGWCKANLADVLSQEKQKFQKLYTKGKSNRGVSRTEVFTELELATKQDKEQQKLMNSAVKRIRANNKANIVRPDWMLPTAARFCTDSIVALSMDIEERSHEEAYRLWYLLSNSGLDEPVPSVRRIKSAILGLAFAAVSQHSHSQSKLSSWLDSLYKSVNALEERNQQQVLIDTVSTASLDFSDLEDFCY